MNGVGGHIHLHLHGSEERGVGNAVAEHAVALVEGAAVAYEGVEIERIGLRDHHVHQAAALVGGASDDVDILRRRHDEGEGPDVSRQALIFLSLALERLASPGSDAERELLVDAVAQIEGAHHGEVVAAAYHLRVGHPREAFAEAEEVYGVEQVALPHAVVAQQGVDLGGEGKRGFGDILEAVDLYLFENHVASVEAKLFE